MPHIITIAVLCLFSFLAAMPSQDPPRRPAPEPRNFDADVESIDAIIATLYDVISGEQGAERDWDRFRNLFTPGARLIPVQVTAEGEIASNAWSPEAYIVRAGDMFEQRGFYEKEISRRVEQFGNIAHIWSTYETRANADDKLPGARGINSIQLMNDGMRWWIVNIFWQGEDDNHPLPEQYVK